MCTATFGLPSTGPICVAMRRCSLVASTYNCVRLGCRRRSRLAWLATCPCPRYQCSPRRERQRALPLAHASLDVLEPLHHLLELGVLLQQSIHVGDRGAASARDPGAPAAVDDAPIPPLLRPHLAVHPFQL